MSKVAGAAYEHGLTGLEFASGIPGSLGGAVVMNAGAYGGQMADVIKSVRMFDAKTGETYVTEFVPGITDEEQRTGETFNIRDHLSR